MDSTPPANYLNVPVTDAERAQARQRRDDSTDRLLPEPSPLQSEEYSSSYGRQPRAPFRFPSIHAAPVTGRFPPSDGQKFDSRPYAPVSPIQDDDDTPSIPLRDPSEPYVDTGRLLPPLGPTPPLWTPIWLTQWILGLFALLFASLVVGLALLWHYDRQHRGYRVDDGANHYAWTYAPTAVLVLLVAAWRMVDFHCKLAMPFDALQDGPIKPSKGLLVDYISEFQLASLFKAFQKNHFAVVASVVGFILLKVATVFSTGLLVLLPTQVTHGGVSIQSRGFTSSSFDPRSPLDATTFSPIPVYAYYATLTQGMPLEEGLTPDLAYAIVTVNSDASIGKSAVITAEVDAFIPTMTCQAVEAILDTPAVVNDTNAADAFSVSSNISFTIPAGNVCGSRSSVTVPADNPYTDIVPERQITGTMQQVFCGSPNASVPDSKGPFGLLFTTTDIIYRQMLFENATDLVTIADDVSRTLKAMTNVFCVPSYTISKVQYTNDTRVVDSQHAVHIDEYEGTTNETLPQFSDWNATNVFMQASISAEPLFGDTLDDATVSGSSGVFTLMALTLGSKALDPLIDSKNLIAAAQQTYKGILSQYAHRQLRSSDEVGVDDGEAIRMETRLRVNEGSVWTVASSFGLLVLITVALIFIAPRAVVPRDPRSTSTIATILTRSTELNRLLRKQGAPNHANHRSALAGYEFGTAIATTDSGTTSFKIVTSEGEADLQSTMPPTDFKWWLPVTATVPVVGLTLILPLILIAVLEVIQRISERDQGLYTVTDDTWTEIYSHYIPAIVMLVLASMINMLDFNVALFSPWVNLAKGNTVGRRSVLSHILGNTPPHACLQALRARYVGALLSIVAATLASFLAVIVSGLYYVQHFRVAGPVVSLTQLDSFDLRWPNSFITDNGAAAVVDLIVHQNFTFPQFTYEGLVFPRLSLNNSEVGADASIMFDPVTSHKLPALRGNLRCEILPASSYNVSTEAAGPGSAFSTDVAFVNAAAALPESCRLGGYQGNSSVVTYENIFDLSDGAADGLYAGAQLDLLFGENATLYSNFGEANGQYIGDNPAVGCPSLAFTFGRFQLGNTDKSQVTTMVCYQEILQLETNVTFKPNSTLIDPRHPPVVHDGTVSVQPNPANDTAARSFDFRIQNNLLQEITPSSGARGYAPVVASTAPIDIYFDSILNGLKPHDPSSLVGKHNQDALIDAINQFYRIYMAQAISANMRVPANGKGPASTLLRRQDSVVATLTTTIDRARLVQDKDSEITLQILSSITVILAAAAIFTTKMRRVLPCNPCSLAGHMSLLAGSDFCHSIDDGLCECCGKPRRRSFGHDDHGRPENIHAGPDEADHDDREQVIPDGAEWMPQRQFETIFASGQRYSMGWWRERKHFGKRRRFGVDIGARADGADDQDWELGQRRPEGPGFGNFMGRGDRDARGAYEPFGRRGSNGLASANPPGGEALPREELPTSPKRARQRQAVEASGGGPGPATLARRQATLGGEA